MTSEACPKITYVSRREARTALKRTDAYSGTDGRDVYRCKRCPYWHIGHKRGKGQRKNGHKHL